VAAATLGLEPGSTAELRKAEDEGLVEQAARGQIFQKRGEGEIERRAENRFQAVRLVEVAVPNRAVVGLVGATIPIDLDEADPGFNEPAGEQDMLAEGAHPVAGARVGRFVIQKESGTGARGEEQVEGAARMGVEDGGGGRGVRPAGEPVEEVAAVAEAVWLQAGGKSDLGDASTLG
jgi:hypothetical protein